MVCRELSWRPFAMLIRNHLHRRRLTRQPLYSHTITMLTLLASIYSLGTSRATPMSALVPFINSRRSLEIIPRACDMPRALNPCRNSTHPSQLRLSFPRRRFLDVLFWGFLSSSPAKSNAQTRDPKTGILLPSVGEIESSIPTVWDEELNPFESAGSSFFSRLDSSPDTIFYSEPRFVEHVDAQAVETMISYISDELIRPGDSVLDLCSSWTSHISSSSSIKLKRVAGLGMNEEELKANPALTDWTVLDLNKDKNVTLPYKDESFDVVLCQLSIDYLIYPLNVLSEAARVLKPGGTVAILFSNRLFLSKAIGLWTGSDDIEHAYTVGSYLHYCKGNFKNIRAEELSTRRQKGKEKVVVGDPLYVVTASKS